MANTRIECGTQEGWKYLGDTGLVPDFLSSTLDRSPRVIRGYTIAQDSKIKDPLSWVAMSVVPRKGGGGLVLISSEKNNPLWANLTSSLLAYPPEKRVMAIVNYVVCYCDEQLILSPSWWEKLSKESQEALVNAWSVGYYPRYLKRLCDWGPIVSLS